MNVGKDLVLYSGQDPRPSSIYAIKQSVPIALNHKITPSCPHQFFLHYFAFAIEEFNFYHNDAAYLRWSVGISGRRWMINLTKSRPSGCGCGEGHQVPAADLLPQRPASVCVHHPLLLLLLLLLLLGGSDSQLPLPAPSAGVRGSATGQ